MIGREQPFSLVGAALKPSQLLISGFGVRVPGGAPSLNYHAAITITELSGSYQRQLPATVVGYEAKRPPYARLERGSREGYRLQLGA
jgi:hypothetical protein